MNFRITFLCISLTFPSMHYAAVPPYIESDTIEEICKEVVCHSDLNKVYKEKYFTRKFNKAFAVSSYKSGNKYYIDYAYTAYQYPNSYEAKRVALKACMTYGKNCKILLLNNSIYDEELYNLLIQPVAFNGPSNSSNKIPFNATASGSSWKCNSGFKRSYVNENSCVKTSSIKIPANAYASGFDNQGWKCNSGFTQSGNSCKKNTNSSSNSPANSYKTASGWKCNSGFFRLSTSDYCYSLPDNSYALSPIGFECKSGYKKSQYDYVCIKSPKISNIKSNDNSKDANDKYVSDTLEGKGVLGKVLSWAGLTNSKSPKTKVSSQKKIVIPANAYAYNNSWKCLDGYKKTGNSCTKEIYIPANAYASGTSWQCIDGYKKKGYRCAKLTWKDGDYWDQEVSPGVSRISAFGAILTQMGSNNRTNTNFNTNVRNTSPKFSYRYGDQLYDSNNRLMGYIKNGTTYNSSMQKTGTIRNNNIYNNTGNYITPLGQNYKPANATFDMTPGF